MRLESENSLIYLIIMPLPPKPASKNVVTPVPKDGSKAPVKDGAKAPAPATKDGAKGGKKGGNPKDVKPTA
jgi:hypothetical protein